MNEKKYKKYMHWLIVCLSIFSLFLANIMPVYAAGASVKKAASIATYSSNDDEEDDGDEDGDEDGDDGDDGDEDDGDEDDGDEDAQEPKEVKFVRVGTIEYNTNNGTKPKYSAKIAEGGAAVAYEGWSGSDHTKSYSTYAAYDDEDDIFETFKEGIVYSYSIRIAAKKGYIFPDEVRVQLNDTTFVMNPNKAHNMITLRNVYSHESVCEHVWIDKKVKVTCVSDGYTTHTCKYCGATYTDNYIKARGAHSWVLNEDESQLASEDEDGDLTYECEYCGEEKEEHVPKIKTVFLSNTKYTYNGKEMKPGVTVTDAKGNTISSFYYKVTYEDNKNAGTATASVEFTGKYDTVIDKEFTIARASQTISASVSSKSYKKATVAKASQSFSIGAKAKSTLSYKSGSKYLTVSSKGKVTVKKGTPKGSYKITVSAKKSTNYNAATKTITVKVS